MSTELLERQIYDQQDSESSHETGHEQEPLALADLKDAVTEVAYDSDLERGKIWDAHKADDDAYQQRGLAEYNSGNAKIFRTNMASFANHPDGDISRWASQKTKIWEERSFPKAQDLALTSEAARKIRLLMTQANLWDKKDQSSPVDETSMNRIVERLMSERNRAEYRKEDGTVATCDRAQELLQAFADNPDLGREMAAAQRERDADPSYPKFNF